MAVQINPNKVKELTPAQRAAVVLQIKEKLGLIPEGKEYAFASDNKLLYIIGIAIIIFLLLK